MFTGIVQGTAAVAELDSKDNFKSFKIDFPAGKTSGVQIGASVAINGTCLTVTAIDENVLSFDVMMETLRATSLGALQVERACSWSCEEYVPEQHQLLLAAAVSHC
jgi:riboflavin synthase